LRNVFYLRAIGTSMVFNRDVDVAGDLLLQ